MRDRGRTWLMSEGVIRLACIFLHAEINAGQEEMYAIRQIKVGESRFLPTVVSC